MFLAVAHQGSWHHSSVPHYSQSPVCPKRPSLVPSQPPALAHSPAPSLSGPGQCRPTNPVLTLSPGVTNPCHSLGEEADSGSGCWDVTLILDLGTREGHGDPATPGWVPPSILSVLLPLLKACPCWQQSRQGKPESYGLDGSP